MELTLNSYQENVGAEILCPSCGGKYLRHERIELFEREEDRGQGLHVSVAEGKALIDTNLAGNPSERRHGLSIHFACELCPAKPVLTIAQHKGTTFLNMCGIPGPVTADF